MAEQDEIEALRRALDAGMAASDIDNVVPIIVPRTYFELESWAGPFSYLRSTALGITWTVLHADQTMVYVNKPRAQAWENDAIDWRAQAQRNLERFSGDPLWTHEKRDAGGRLLWAAMMHDDGLGSSRLLLGRRLLDAVGEYRVAIPDRSCAIVVPLAAGRANLDDVGEMVRGMFQRATTPMLADVLDPAELELQP